MFIGADVRKASPCISSTTSASTPTSAADPDPDQRIHLPSEVRAETLDVRTRTDRSPVFVRPDTLTIIGDKFAFNPRPDARRPRVLSDAIR